MAIRHLISNPVAILTPCKDGKAYIRYQSGQLALVEVSELHADNGIQEIGARLFEINATWDWAEWDSPNWHVQGTFRDAQFNARASQYRTVERDASGRPVRAEMPDGTTETWEFEGERQTTFTRQ